MSNFSRSSKPLRALALLLLLAPVRAGAADPFDAHYKHAISLSKGGHYENALREMEAAYALKPWPRLLYNLGQLHRKLRQFEEALQSFELFLRTDPSVKPELRKQVEEYLAELRTTEPAKTPAAAPAAPASAPVQADLRAGVPSQPQDRSLGLLASVPAPRSRPIYKRWKFWTALGAVAAGVTAAALVGGLYGSQGPSIPDGVESGHVTPAAAALHQSWF